MTLHNTRYYGSKYLLCLAMIFSYMAFILYQAAILPVWHDEAITLLDIAGNPIPKWPSGVHSISDLLNVMSGTGEIKDIPGILITTDVHPPVYYIVANIWSQIFGNNILAVRGLSVLMAGGSMFLIWSTFFKQGEEERNASLGAYLALLMMIASPTFAYVSLNARGYSVAMFLVAIVIFLAHLQITRTEQKPKRIFAMLAGTGVMSALAFLTNYMTIFVTGPILLFLAVKNIRKHMALVLVAAAITIGVASFSLPFLAEQMGARPDQYAGFSSWGKETLAVLIGLMCQFSEPVWQGVAGPVIMVCVFMVLGLIFAGTVSLRKNSLILMHGLVAICYVMGILVLFWKTDKTLLHAMTARYMCFVVPSLAILVGQVINNISTQKMTAGIVGGFLAVCSLNMWGIQGGPTSDPWAIKPAIDRLVASFEVNDPDENMMIFATKARGIVSVPILAVDPETQVGIAASEDEIGDIIDVAKTKKTIFYVANSNSEKFARIGNIIRSELELAGFHNDGSFIWTRSVE